MESLAAEWPAQQQVEFVAGDRCFPLTHSDVSQRTAAPAAGEGEALNKWGEEAVDCVQQLDEQKDKTTLKKIRHFPCLIISHVAT